MKFDLVLDTHILNEILLLYFNDFKEMNVPRLSKLTNLKLKEIIFNKSDTYRNYIIVSIYAIIELLRKFDEISKKRYTLDKFTAFLYDPPEWFIIEGITQEIISSMNDIPPVVKTERGIEPLEWVDSLHLATAMLRENGKLVTLDHKLLAINHLEKYLAR